MIRICTLALLTIVGACGSLIYDDALERALRNDKAGAAKVGTDAKAVLWVSPGHEHFIDRGSVEHTQVHLYSRMRDRTTVVDGYEMRQYNAQIVVIATYMGGPPPPKGWAKKQ
ncbi:MAG: hypothetical protein ACYSX0_06290 [Planctomycetota bacterium]|jgi:hypothetical protein